MSMIMHLGIPKPLPEGDKSAGGLADNYYSLNGLVPEDLMI